MRLFRGRNGFLIVEVCLFVQYGHHQSTQRRKRMKIFSHTSSDDGGLLGLQG